MISFSIAGSRPRPRTRAPPSARVHTSTTNRHHWREPNNGHRRRRLPRRDRMLMHRWYLRIVSGRGCDRAGQAAHFTLRIVSHGRFPRRSVLRFETVRISGEIDWARPDGRTYYLSGTRDAGCRRSIFDFRAARRSASGSAGGLCACWPCRAADAIPIYRRLREQVGSRAPGRPGDLLYFHARGTPPRPAQSA